MLEQLNQSIHPVCSGINRIDLEGQWANIEGYKGPVMPKIRLKAALMEAAFKFGDLTLTHRSKRDFLLPWERDWVEQGGEETVESGNFPNNRVLFRQWILDNAMPHDLVEVMRRDPINTPVLDEAQAVLGSATEQFIEGVPGLFAMEALRTTLYMLVGAHPEWVVPISAVALWNARGQSRVESAVYDLANKGRRTIPLVAQAYARQIQSDRMQRALARTDTTDLPEINEALIQSFVTTVEELISNVKLYGQSLGGVLGAGVGSILSPPFVNIATSAVTYASSFLLGIGIGNLILRKQNNRASRFHMKNEEFYQMVHINRRALQVDDPDAIRESGNRALDVAGEVDNIAEEINVASNTATSLYPWIAALMSAMMNKVFSRVPFNVGSILAGGLFANTYMARAEAVVQKNNTRALKGKCIKLLHRIKADLKPITYTSEFTGSEVPTIEGAQLKKIRTSDKAGQVIDWELEEPYVLTRGIHHLAGRSGIGKTRLLEWLRFPKPDEGYRVVLPDGMAYERGMDMTDHFATDSVESNAPFGYILVARLRRGEADHLARFLLQSQQGMDEMDAVPDKGGLDSIVRQLFNELTQFERIREKQAGSYPLLEKVVEYINSFPFMDKFTLATLFMKLEDGSSAGQFGRVRTLLALINTRPEGVLLDEPLAHVDRRLQASMARFIINWYALDGKIVLVVDHTGEIEIANVLYGPQLYGGKLNLEDRMVVTTAGALAKREGSAETSTEVDLSKLAIMDSRGVNGTESLDATEKAKRVEDIGTIRDILHNWVEASHITTDTELIAILREINKLIKGRLAVPFQNGTCAAFFHPTSFSPNAQGPFILDDLNGIFKRLRMTDYEWIQFFEYDFGKLSDSALYTKKELLFELYRMYIRLELHGSRDWDGQPMRYLIYGDTSFAVFRDLAVTPLSTSVNKNTILTRRAQVYRSIMGVPRYHPKTMTLDPKFILAPNNYRLFQEFMLYDLLIASTGISKFRPIVTEYYAFQSLPSPLGYTVSLSDASDVAQYIDLAMSMMGIHADLSSSIFGGLVKELPKIITRFSHDDLVMLIDVIRGRSSVTGDFYDSSRLEVYNRNLVSGLLEVYNLINKQYIKLNN